jgi:hypothetical protein
MEKQIAKEKIAEALRNYAQQNGNGGELTLREDSFEQLADVAAAAVAGGAEDKKNNGLSALDLANFKIDPPYGVR